jgi:hypothetical protein
MRLRRWRKRFFSKSCLFCRILFKVFLKMCARKGRGGPLTGSEHNKIIWRHRLFGGDGALLGTDHYGTRQRLDPPNILLRPSPILFYYFGPPCLPHALPPYGGLVVGNPHPPLRGGVKRGGVSRMHFYFYFLYGASLLTPQARLASFQGASTLLTFECSFKI